MAGGEATLSGTYPPFCSTSGKLPLVGVADGGPDLWVRGEGARFWDRAGRAWLDFDLCLGSVVWGHGREEIVAAAGRVPAGAPTVPSIIEEEATQTLLARLDRYEAVRFFKTGADSCAVAIRLARQATGRDLVLSDGYHGWHDWSAAGAYSEAPEPLGIPDAVAGLTVTLNPSLGPQAAMTVLNEVGSRLAAMVVRPEAWPAVALQELVERARRLGAVIICDEVTSHLKYSRLGSAAERGAEPDMICIGKGLANGMPVAALLGPSALVDRLESARISSTNWSEIWSLAGLIAAEALLAGAPVWPSWRNELARVVDALSGLVEELAPGGEFALVAHPGFFSIERRGRSFRSDPFRRHLASELGRRGLYTRGWFHGSDAHCPGDWDRLEEALSGAMLAWCGR
jgi:glutamate-1-semialdehyde 2,1-aminomutase